MGDRSTEDVIHGNSNRCEVENNKSFKNEGMSSANSTSVRKNLCQPE